MYLAKVSTDLMRILGACMLTKPTETLFFLFYQHPADLKQELAAIELTNREWRWHKVLRQWLRKDTHDPSSSSSLPIVDMASSLPVGAQPVRLGDRTERGVYVFFDAMNWQRQRREFVLDYAELDHRHAVPAAVGPAPGLGLGTGMVVGVGLDGGAGQGQTSRV